MFIYTDGSYKDNKICYGFIAVKNGNIINKYYHIKEDYTGLNNVVAELKAVMLAVKFARQKNEKVNIFTDLKACIDFLQIEKPKYSIEYSSFINNYKIFMKNNSQYYNLIKVKGHSTNKYNKEIHYLVYGAINGKSSLESGKLERIRISV